MRLLVRPDMLFRWRRDLNRRGHAARSKPQRPGRPPTVRSSRVLVLRLVRKNPQPWSGRRCRSSGTAVPAAPLTASPTVPEKRCPAAAPDAVLAMDVPEHDGLGTALMWQGGLRGDPDLLNEAITHFEVGGSLLGQGNALRERADIERRTGAGRTAARSYDEALACLRRATDPYGEALALLGLAGSNRPRGTPTQLRPS